MPYPRPIIARRISNSCSSVSRRYSQRFTYRFPSKRIWPRHEDVNYFPLNLQSRCASTSAAAVASTAASQDARSLLTRVKNLLLGTTIGLTLVLGYYYVSDTRASFHEWLVIPCLRYFYPDAEDGHEFGNRALKVLGSFGLHPRERGNPDAKGDLAVDVFGHTLSNPIGTSAGIDKHCDIPDILFAAGPAIVEIGGVTPLPQEGNPKPRVWRIPSQKALINRYGLNSEGADHVAMRLRQRVREFAYHMGFGIDEEAEQRVLDGDAGVPAGSLQQHKLLSVQVAKNKFTLDEDIEAVKKDYVYCAERLARYADILVVNVSSPNTPGLRGLQKVKPLTDILTAVVGATRNVRRRTPPKVMVKVSPDEDSEEDVRGICEAVRDSDVDGVIVGNSTKFRPDPVPQGYILSAQEQKILREQGGFSGPHTFDRTVALVKRYRKMLDEGAYANIEDKTPHSSNQTPDDGSPSTFFTVSSPLETPEATHPPTTDKEIEESVARDSQRLKPQTSEADADSKSQPMIRIPERNTPFSSTHASKDEPQQSAPANDIQQLAASSSTDTTPSPSTTPTSSTPTIPSSTSERTRKVIFATGGITNGAQALEVLAAGADVALLYTTLVFSGIGTISKIKGQMREELKQRNKP